MGILCDLVTGRKDYVREAVERGRAAWQSTFGDVSRNKEEGYKQPPVRGGSYGRSVASGGNAYKRLLEAFRSNAPGGWTDDRWEQSKHWEGLQYVFGHRTGELLSQADFQVFRKDENHQDGKRPVSRRKDPDAYRLVELLEKPNGDDTFGDMMYKWNQQMVLTGSALTWEVPSKLPSQHPNPVFQGCGTPCELYPIPTATAIPQPTINPDYPEGYYRIQPLYPYGPFSQYPTPNSSVGAPLAAQWILKFQFPHPLLRYDGFSPLTALRLYLDELLMMDKSRHYKMRGSVNPSAVLNLEEMEGIEPLPETEIERIHAEWENSFQGPENHGKLIVGTPGGRLEEFGIPVKEMDYVSSWDQLTSFCLGALGITKPAAGMIEDATYATLFATLKQLYWLTLDPICNRFASKLTRHLAPHFGDDLIVEIKCKRIDDHEVAFNKCQVAAGAKAITKNEVRKLLELPVTKQEWGMDIAGDPTPFEKEQMAQEQQLAMMAQQMAPEGAEGGSSTPPSDQDGQPVGPSELDEILGLAPQQDETLEQQRPDTGTLNQGSLGPRMASLRGYRTKSANGVVEKLFRVCEGFKDIEDEHGPDYQRLFWNPNTKQVWWESADGDSEKAVREIHSRLEAVPGVEEVLGESESSPPDGEGWELIWPKRKEWKSIPTARIRTKSLYQQIREAIHTNGNGRHG